MPTSRETILTALHARLSALPATALRSEVLPERVPVEGLLTGSIEVRVADQTLVTRAINGDPCELECGYVLPSGESFTFTVHGV